MTKYICECDAQACRCVIECSIIGFAPFWCSLTGESSCNWLRVEDQKPELPEWFKVGVWVWNDEIGYGKIEQEPRTGELLVFFGGGTRAFEAERYKEARLRPWNDDELKSKVGKVFEMGNGDLTLCLGYQRDIADLIFVGKLMSAQSFAETDWKLDGLPCGVFEHRNEQGEWVK